SQPNAVQAVQHPDDFFRVTLYKTKHGVAPGGEGFVEKTTLPPGARLSSFQVPVASSPILLAVVVRPKAMRYAGSRLPAFAV
ncbi:MAG TPA: hypothetical protein VFI31_18425, partial [Pirellulales bacterium]|nr:hypothetical protein [Pirellulales bacterium]